MVTSSSMKAPAMMDQTAEVARRALADSAELAKTWPLGSALEKELTNHWKAHRPKMVRALAQHGAVGALAHVLVHLTLEADKQYRKAGMMATDAWEQAEREHLLREPEAEDDPPIPSKLLDLLRPVQTTTSETLTA